MRSIISLSLILALTFPALASDWKPCTTTGKGEIKTWALALLDLDKTDALWTNGHVSCNEKLRRVKMCLAGPDEGALCTETYIN
jgi:hypothetical protein